MASKDRPHREVKKKPKDPGLKPKIQSLLDAPPQSVELTHDQILLILSGQLPMGVPIGY